MANAAGVWAFALSGAAASQRMVDAHLEADEVHRISGLNAAAPLVVSPTGRQAGAITQSVAEVAGTTTITRLT